MVRLDPVKTLELPDEPMRAASKPAPADPDPDSGVAYQVKACAPPRRGPRRTLRSSDPLAE